MAEKSCPHCGVAHATRSTLWRHIRSCEKNPDPVCGKCGLHFSPHKLAGHQERCGAKSKRVDGASSDEELPEGKAASAAALDVPAERRTPTDELVLPLMRPPSEKPTPPPPAKPAAKRASKTRATPQAAATNSPEEKAGAARDESASQSASPSQDGGLAGKFETAREPPRLSAFTGLGESIKRNWVLLAIVGGILLVLIVWRRLTRETEKPSSQAAVPQAPPQPASRPPYNPEVHGSVEQYRLTYEHLPSRSGGA